MTLFPTGQRLLDLVTQLSLQKINDKRFATDLAELAKTIERSIGALKSATLSALKRQLVGARKSPLAACPHNTISRTHVQRGPYTADVFAVGPKFTICDGFNM